MEQIVAGRPVTPLEAIAIVEAGRFPPGEAITFPDGIEPPPDRPDTQFFDPERVTDPPDIELQRRLRTVDRDDGAGPFARIVAWFADAVTGPQREEFQLGERIGYVDKTAGVIIVPADLGTFRTDLTSVPRFFTWLVPKTGIHLPAALLHDGLVHTDAEPQSYIAAEPVDRQEADRIFRDAMGDLGTPVLRRWLIWTTVMLATLTGSTQRLRWYLTIGLTLLVVITLGVLATIDLVDYRAPLPWMADRPWWVEVATGFAFAVLIPAVLCLTWGPRWIVGVITAVAVAFLFHVTALIVAVYSSIGLLEGLVGRDWRKVGTYVAALLALAAIGAVIAGLLALT